MLDKINNILFKIEELLIAFFTIAGMLIVFTNVVLRYGFNSGLFWGLEATTYLIAWAVLIGTAYGFGKKNHLGINILISKLKGKPRQTVMFIALGLTFTFIAIVFYNSISYVLLIRNWGDLSLDLKIPQWIPYLALPVGLGLALFHLLILIFECWHNEKFSLSGEEVNLEDAKLE